MPGAALLDPGCGQGPCGAWWGEARLRCLCRVDQLRGGGCRAGSRHPDVPQATSAAPQVPQPGSAPATSPGRGVMLSPLPPRFAGAGPAASQTQLPATPTQPTSSSRGSPIRGCRPPVPVKPTTSRQRAQPGASGTAVPSGRGSLLPLRKSDGAAGPAVCRGDHPVGARSAPPAWAGRKDRNRPFWRGTRQDRETAR